MKFLILLILVIACGKNSEPISQDFRDSDGDHVANVVDNDKFQANVIQIEGIDAELEFITGETNLARHRFSLSNNVDLKSYSKDLLINKGTKTPDYDYFSEFSLLKVNSKKEIPKIADYLAKIQLTFAKIKSPPTSLYLVSKTKKTKLGNWAPIMEVSLKGNELNSILAGESFLSLSHMDDKRHSSGETKGDNIKEKTYRVFYDDGFKTEVSYLSKELSLDEVLTKLHIDEYHLIDDQNLLTTTLRDQTPKWWVRFNDKNEIIVIKENLDNISNYYLQGLQKSNAVAARVNGIGSNKYIFNNSLSPRVLLKIRTEQSFASFVESSKDERKRVGGKDESDKSGCVEHSRTLGGDFLANQQGLNLQSVLLINGTPFHGRMKNVTMIKSSDAIGIFWEIEIFGFNIVELSLVNLPSAEYRPTGLYQTTSCIGNSRNAVYNNNPQTQERSLKLHIETFVENIRE
jgi:hypothetical protein